MNVMYLLMLQSRLRPWITIIFISSRRHFHLSCPLSPLRSLFALSSLSSLQAFRFILVQTTRPWKHCALMHDHAKTQHRASTSPLKHVWAFLSCPQSKKFLFFIILKATFIVKIHYQPLLCLKIAPANTSDRSLSWHHFGLVISV